MHSRNRHYYHIIALKSTLKKEEDLVVNIICVPRSINIKNNVINQKKVRKFISTSLACINVLTERFFIYINNEPRTGFRTFKT